MPSNELIRAVNSYEQYIEKNGISESLLNAYVQATKVALQTENARMRKRGKSVWRLVNAKQWIDKGC